MTQEERMAKILSLPYGKEALDMFYNSKAISIAEAKERKLKFASPDDPKWNRVRTVLRILAGEDDDTSHDNHRI